MNYKLYYIIGIMSMLSLFANAQSDDDFCIWSSVGVEKKLNKKWALEGELEFRSRDNLSETGRWSAKIGGDYKIVKNLEIGAAYQFQYFYDLEYNDFQPRHRLMGTMQGKQRWRRFQFSLRERVQGTYKDDSDRIKSNGKVDTYKMDPEWTWKNRLKVAYDIPKCKFEPSLSFETFYQLNNPDGNEFDGLRYTLSVDYKLDEQSTFTLSGIYDHEMNVNDPIDRYVLSLEYVYSF